MLEHLGPLIENRVDCFYIEGIRKSIDYNTQVVSIYRRAIDALLQDPQDPVNPDLVAELQKIQPANRPLGTGFYFKEQIY